MNEFWHAPMINALTAGIAVWLATAAGAAWVFVHRMLGERSRAVLVGAATGVMLAVIFELACSSRKMAHDSLIPLLIGFGAALITHVSTVLPYALAFAGGAMLYVVLDELVPEIRRSANCHKAILGAVAGFVLMIALSVVLP